MLLKTFANCHFLVVLFLFPSHLTEKQQQISILTNTNKTVPTPVLLKNSSYALKISSIYFNYKLKFSRAYFM